MPVIFLEINVWFIEKSTLFTMKSPWAVWTVLTCSQIYLHRAVPVFCEVRGWAGKQLAPIVMSYDSGALQKICGPGCLAKYVFQPLKTEPVFRILPSFLSFRISGTWNSTHCLWNPLYSFRIISLILKITTLEVISLILKITSVY